MTVGDLLEIIEHRHGEKEIDEAHEKLVSTLKDIDKDTLELLCIRLVYSIDVLKNM